MLVFQEFGSCETKKVTTRQENLRDIGNGGGLPLLLPKGRGFVNTFTKKGCPFQDSPSERKDRNYQLITVSFLVTVSPVWLFTMRIIYMPF